MFPGDYFAARYFAPRYFAKVGATPTFKPLWAVNANKTVGMDIYPE
jgi:hypothetical protein